MLETTTSAAAAADPAVSGLAPCVGSYTLSSSAHAEEMQRVASLMSAPGGPRGIEVARASPRREIVLHLPY